MFRQGHSAHRQRWKYSQLIMASPSKKPFLLRLDPSVLEALQRWADDDLRSLNAHLDYLLRESLRKAGRKPSKTKLDPPRTEDDFQDKDL